MRWMSLESLETSKFTLKSDVWSFAIVMTELFSYGATPYGEMNTLIIAYKIADGLRPDKPAACPPELFELMQVCWDADAEKRPTFQMIAREITKVDVCCCAECSSRCADACGRRASGASAAQHPRPPQPGPSAGAARAHGRRRRILCRARQRVRTRGGHLAQH